MKRTLLYFLSILLLSSCSTILQKRHYALNIQSNEAKAKVKVYDTIYTLPAKAWVARSNKDLKLTLLTDTKSIEFSAKPKLTPLFIYGNLFGYFFINYPIDLTNHKRFYYGKSLLLNSADSTAIIVEDINKFSKKKGEFDLHISIPVVNAFYLKPIGETPKSHTGYLGLSLGLDYYHQSNQYLSFVLTGAADIFSYAPQPYTWQEEYQQMYTSYMGLSNNHKIKRFSIGYGISYSKNNWDKTVYTFFLFPLESIHKSNNALGLLIPAYYQLGKSINLGIVYRPTVYRFTPIDQHQYEHLISLDFAWKIKL